MCWFADCVTLLSARCKYKILTNISLSFEVLMAVSSNTLKSDNLIYTHKFISYLRENTVQVHCKKQSVNAVWGNNMCLLSDSHKTSIQ